MANIARWDPFDDSLFDMLPAFFGRPGPGRSAEPALRLDLAETDQDYRVSVDLPGIPKDSIQVSIDRNNITIGAERRDEKSVDDRSEWLLRERFTGKLNRTLALPQPVDEGRAEARHVDGVLYLTLPKQAGASKRLTVH
jgi:HSP20 family protein